MKISLFATSYRPVGQHHDYNIEQVACQGVYKLNKLIYPHALTQNVKLLHGYLCIEDHLPLTEELRSTVSVLTPTWSLMCSAD
jgi:hypothetical protein